MPKKSYSELMSDYFSFTARGIIIDNLFRTLERLGLSDFNDFTVTLSDGVINASSLFNSSNSTNDNLDN